MNSSSSQEGSQSPELYFRLICKLNLYLFYIPFSFLHYIFIVPIQKINKSDKTNNKKKLNMQKNKY